MLDLLGFTGTGPILVLVTVIVVALLIFYVASRYRVANANEALVVAGSRGAKVRDEKGKLVAAVDDKGVKVVVGGGTFVLPLVHKVGRLKLTVRQIEVRLADAVTSQGIKVNVQGVATFKIGRDVESLRNAAERFLDARDEHVDSIVKNVLEGSLRSIVGRLTIEELIMDRQKLQQEVQDAAKGDLASSGLQIDAFTIQSINDESGYVELLGQQKLAVVEKDARMAKAAADQLASVREAEAEGIKIQAQRDVALKRAEAQVQTAAAEARAAQAGPLAQAEATQQVVAKQTQLAELEASRVEMELLSTTVKPAAAQAQAAIQRAEGDKRARIAQAEAGAEAERLQGAAEAAVVLTKGEAEAKALAMRADAYKQFNEAAIIQTVLAALPEIVRAAAEPMKHIDTLTVMSTDGASEVVRNATRVVAESGTVIKSLTGIDVPTLIGGAMRTGGFTSKPSGGDGSEPAKAPPTPPSAQTPRPPAGMPPLNASAAVEPEAPVEPIDPVERSAARLAANLLVLPEIQRYAHLSLRDIPAGAPRPMKILWAAAEKELGSRYGHVTVRELLDRFTGTSLH
ncbi:MAG TPA: SPFH domain-containing protein [Candidatus Limnocylindria bacterium]|nr:SPFH domain-containing protein [Candidatus Limnocylindria bacterium]